MTGITLKYGSPDHERVLKALNARKELSRIRLADRHAQWEKGDQDRQLYVKETDNDALRRQNRDNNGAIEYVTIQIPYTYGMAMTMHTYLTSIFLSRNPVYQFQGRYGESEDNVLAVESLMQYQVQVGGQMAPYYIWFNDAISYGIGIIGSYWAEEEHVISQIERQPVLGPNGRAIPGKTKAVLTKETVEGYKGNKVFNIRPYDYIADPRVPLSDPNRGEFCGRHIQLFHNTLKRRALTGQYYNQKVVEGLMKGKGSDWLNQFFPDTNKQSDAPDISAGSQGTQDNLLYDGVRGYELCVEIIPKQWKLGSTEYPEKWVFTVIQDKVIIEARPLGLYHNRFPYEVMETDIDGYALFKRSLYDTARPMQQTLNWLINTHFYAVRKSLNGSYIYDPSRLTISDMLDDGPGMRVRMRPEAYGSDVRNAIYEINQGAEVTGTHLQDSVFMQRLMEQAFGINATAQGVVNPGGRKTATEVRSSTSSSLSRTKTIAEYISADAMGPFAALLLQTTQQLYEDDQKIRLAGDAVNRPEGFVQVTPESIAGMYDYSPIDGTLPVDRVSLVNMWGGLMAQLRQYPQIAQQYDMAKIFTWVAQLGGIRNIKQFRIDLQDPAQLADQARAGNLVELPNGQRRTNPGGAGSPTAGGAPGSPVTPAAAGQAGVETA